MSNITLGWGSWNHPIFTYAETRIQLFRALTDESQSYSKVCNLTFSGSKYPSITFYTSATYNVPGYGTDRWWAVAPIFGKGRGRIIHNTSARMVGRWKELYSDHQVALQVLFGLWFHELYHILGYTTSQIASYPPSGAVIAKLVKLWGKPKLSRDMGIVENQVYEITWSKESILTKAKTFIWKPDFVVIPGDVDLMKLLFN